MTMPAPGDLLVDRYRIECILGEGGFARVWLATDTNLKRSVAVKVLKSTDQRKVQRFLREVEVVATLAHPNTVTLYDFGQTAHGQLFMVSEYVEGEDLRDLLTRRGALSEPEIVRILFQVASSLQEAHNTGLLHRDIKPENIRVFEYAGDPLRVKVLDFGIARRVSGDARLTSTGKAVGTPRYMAPEQLAGAELTPAMDIFALGLIAYELVLGPVASLSRAMTGFGRVVIDERAPISPPVRRLINAMLEDDPMQRPAASAVVAELTAVIRQSGPSQDAKKTRPWRAVRRGDRSPNDRGQSAVRGRPLALGLVAGSVMAAVGVLAVVSTDEEPVQVVERPEHRETGIVKRRTGPVVERLPDIEPEIDVGADAELVATGCGLPQPANAGIDPINVGFGGHDFAYWVPGNYDSSKKYPVVVMLHAWAQSAIRAIYAADLPRLAGERGFVVIAPRSRTLPIPWRGDAVELVEVGLDFMNRNTCIDRERVFVIGASVGGQAAEEVACQVPISGFATVNHRSDGPPCDTMPPYIHFAGLADPGNPRDGGLACTLRTIPSLEEHDEAYRVANRCSGPRQTTRRDGPHRCFSWTCGTPFVSCHLEGGGAFRGATPDENALCPQVSSGFRISEAALDFFEIN